MNFAYNCKECSCWCLFSMSAILMLLMFSLSLKDMSVVSEYQALVQQIINTPVPQLSCTQICQSWYSQEKGLLCCDRYNMDLCVAKEKCKIQYIKISDVALKNLHNDEFHQIVVGIVCGLVVIIVACRKGKRKTQEKVQQAIESKIMRMMKAMQYKMAIIQTQKRNDTIETLRQQTNSAEKYDKNVNLSTDQEGPYQCANIYMDSSIFNPQVVQYSINDMKRCSNSNNK